MHAEVTEYVTGLFKRHGASDYVGEPVSQQAHAIQCAMHAEAAFPEDKELIVGCFLHDIGHLMGIENPNLVKLEDETDKPQNADNTVNAAMMGDCGCRQHERIGRDWALENGLGQKVAAIIEGHVRAKRYLVTKYDQYYNKLSDASKTTLMYQGGKLTEEEVLSFEKDQWFELHLKVRDFDDKAKIKDYKMKPVEYYLEMVEQVVAMHKGKSGEGGQ